MRTFQQLKPAAAGAIALFTLLAQAAPSPVVPALVKRAGPSAPPGYKPIPQIQNANFWLASGGNNMWTGNCPVQPSQNIPACAAICTADTTCRTFDSFYHVDSGQFLCCTYQGTGLNGVPPNSPTATPASSSYAYEQLTVVSGWDSYYIGNYAVKSTDWTKPASSPDGYGYIRNMQDLLPATMSFDDSVTACINWCDGVTSYNYQHPVGSPLKYLPCVGINLYEVWSTTVGGFMKGRACTGWSLPHYTFNSPNYGAGGSATASSNRNSFFYNMDPQPMNQDAQGWVPV
ncbi:hypothetical protein ABW21_db0206875 [Orbilia brochopaga]|nr:hypothetical protein ABW21_db0206875 [Drechslerella brochopaga]